MWRTIAGKGNEGEDILVTQTSVELARVTSNIQTVHNVKLCNWSCEDREENNPNVFMPELVCTCLVVSLVTRDRLHLLLHPPLCPHLLLLTTRQLGTNIYISYGGSKIQDRSVCFLITASF